jgi:hypothetical protein
MWTAPPLVGSASGRRANLRQPPFQYVEKVVPTSQTLSGAEAVATTVMRASVGCIPNAIPGGFSRKSFSCTAEAEGRALDGSLANACARAGVSAVASNNRARRRPLSAAALGSGPAEAAKNPDTSALRRRPSARSAQRSSVSSAPRSPPSCSKSWLQIPTRAAARLSRSATPLDRASAATCDPTLASGPASCSQALTVDRPPAMG